MKKIIYSLFLLVTLNACSQEAEEMRDEGLPAHEDKEMTGQDTLDLERGRGSND